MGKRDYEINLGLPDEIASMVKAEANRTDDHRQDVIREALRDYFLDRDLSGDIEAQLTTIEAEIDELDNRIDEKRDELRDLQRERDELERKRDELKEQLAGVGDDVTGESDAVDRIAAAAEDVVGEHDERVLTTDPVVEESAEQLGAVKSELLEAAYAAHPEIPRDCFDAGVILDADRWDDREHVVEVACEYVDEDGASPRARSLIKEASDELGVPRYELKDAVRERFDEDVFEP